MNMHKKKNNSLVLKNARFIKLNNLKTKIFSEINTNLLQNVSTNINDKLVEVIIVLMLFQLLKINKTFTFRLLTHLGKINICFHPVHTTCVPN